MGVMKVLILMVLLSGQVGLKAQSFEAEQLLLNVEKLVQLKGILDNMYKGYEIVRKGYNAIKDISEGNFSIHKTFLDGLLQVSPVVRKYRRVADIINCQVRIVKEYKAAYNRFRQSGNFSEGEMDYLRRVYDRLFSQSLKKLDDLSMIITANQVRMNDEERLAAIDRIYSDVEDQLSFLRNFNNNTSVLGAQRKRERQNVDAIRKAYGLQ